MGAEILPTHGIPRMLTTLVMSYVTDSCQARINQSPHDGAMSMVPLCIFAMSVSRLAAEAAPSILDGRPLLGP